MKYNKTIIQVSENEMMNVCGGKIRYPFTTTVSPTQAPDAGPKF